MRDVFKRASAYSFGAAYWISLHFEHGGTAEEFPPDITPGEVAARLRRLADRCEAETWRKP